MLAALANFFVKIGIGSIAAKIADAYLAKQTAATEQERIAAEARIRTLEAKRDVLATEGWSRINAIMRAVLTVPVAVLLAKVFIYDKALGQWSGGSTDALSPELWWTVRTVIGFYFLSEAAERVTRIVKRR
jgi:hypothetical protein